MEPNTQKVIKTKHLGVRPTGSTSLTEHMGSPKQNESSSTRNLHTLFITVNVFLNSTMLIVEVVKISNFSHMV